MLFSEQELSLESFEDFSFQMDDTSGLRKPHEIFPQSTFKRFPQFDQKIMWQAFLDEIDFYHTKTLERLLIFAFTQSVAETNPDIPMTYIHGETAEQVYQGFLNIKNVNQGEKATENFLDDAGNSLALQLLRGGYFPSSYNSRKKILLVEKKPEKLTKPQDFELEAEIEIAVENRQKRKDGKLPPEQDYTEEQRKKWEALKVKYEIN